MTALADLRVLDCATGIAGPLAAMFLADFGADVVKVEGREGDPARSEPGFAVWNRNKRSIVIDTETEPGCARIADLLARADVVVTSATLDALRGTLLDPAAACEINEALVYLHAPPFAETTPWAGGHESAGLVSAALAISMRQASSDDVPVDPAFPYLLYGQAIWAATATVAALIERQRSGRGQVVTVGGLHGAMEMSTGGLVIAPDAPVTSRFGGPGGSFPFYRTYKCADGEWLFLAALTPNFYMPAFETLGIMDMLDDERLGHRPGRMLRPEVATWVTDRLAAVFASEPRAHWLDVLSRSGCPAGPVQSRADWLDHPQIAAIGMRAELEDPERGHIVMPGVAAVLEKTPGSVRAPAPALGQHNADGIDWPPPKSLRLEGTADSRSAGPLHGYRVLDLGAVIAGSYACSLLAELGADVVKVEPLTGDSFRGPGFIGYNKGKRGLAVDLRQPEGRELFYTLAAGADIVIDNYRPGVLNRLEVDWESLARVKPDIISVSVTGFGTVGPLGEAPGFDPVLQAMSGMMRAQGGDDEPVFHTVPVNDVASAALAALAACVALYNRNTSGAGQRAWTSLAGTATLMQCGELVRFGERVPPPEGGRDYAGPSVFSRCYATSDGWVRIDARTDDQRAALTRVIGAESEAGLSTHFAAMSSEDAVRQLASESIPIVVARRGQELVRDAELRRLELVHEHRHADGSVRFTVGRLARFSRTERTDVLTPPGLGEHTREVLSEAGVAPERIDELLKDGVIAEGEPFPL